jgi:arginase
MDIDLIGVPVDFGAGRRGVDMGPSAIRYAGLRPALEAAGHTVHDLGNVEVPILETCTVSDARLRYIDCIVPMARRVYGRVAAARDAGRFPLVLGGDHSLSLGSVRGAARRRPVGVIWVDAHADFNTAETTPSGNIHGMPLAALAHIAIVGVRLLDPGERVLLKQAGVNVFSMEQIDRLGLYAATQQAIEVATRDTEGIYLSLDLDALDPLYAPGVGTPEDGGLSYREAHTVCELIADTGKLLGMDVVEVNPILDERNRTAHLAVELVQSALGLRVWRE